MTAVDDAGQSDSAALEVQVVSDACTAAKLNGASVNYYDVDGDCLVDLSDLAAFAAQWLRDIRETATIPY